MEPQSKLDGALAHSECFVQPHFGFLATGLCMSVDLIWTDDDHDCMYVVSPVKLPGLEN